MLLPVSYHFTLCRYDENSNRFISDASITITSQVRCGISQGGLWLHTLECPYTGSSRYVADEQGVLYEGGQHARVTRDRYWVVGGFGFVQKSYIGEKGEFVGRDRCSDLPGIYYRHFVWWKHEGPWWTLKVSLWYLILVSAILPAFWIIRRRELWFRKT
jgi:hypothetical protein